MTNNKILVVDDERIIRTRLKKLLELDDYSVLTAEDGKTCLEIYNEEKPEIVLLDIKMPGMDGMEVLERIKEQDELTQVIVITGHGGVSTAISAMRKGAFAYLQKPLDYDELEIDINRALETLNLQKSLDRHLIELEISEERFRAVAHTAGDTIIIADKKSRINFWNKAAEELFGYTEEEMLGKKLTTIMPEQYKNKHSKGLGNAITPKIFTPANQPMEHEGLKKNGETFPMELTLTRFTTGDDIFFTGIIRDVSLRRKSEEKLKQYRDTLEDMVEERTKELQNTLSSLEDAQTQLLHSEKLASIGQLAAGVAHEINNPATFVNIHVTTIEKWWKKFEPVLEKALSLGWDQEFNIRKFREAMDDFPQMTQSIKKGVSRISTITSALRSFAREDNKQKSSINILEVIESAILISKNEFKYHADLNIERPENLPQVFGSFLQLEQVFINLIVNSAHAIKEKFEQLNEKDEKSKGIISVIVPEGPLPDGMIEIIFRDNGTGIDPGHIHKIFDPFFSTKGQDKGTGLGMSIVHGIIIDHNGTISVESTQGEGNGF